MQTFLPYPDFAKSAEVLDTRRLGKQRVEALQIFNALDGVRRGWSAHPAVLMWRGCEVALVDYAAAMCAEWSRRGYSNAKMDDRLREMRLAVRGRRRVSPSWLGDARFHAAHRSNLLRKYPEHYRRFWPKLRDDLPYVWPTDKAFPKARAVRAAKLHGRRLARARPT